MIKIIFIQRIQPKIGQCERLNGSSHFRNKDIKSLFKHENNSEQCEVNNFLSGNYFSVL